MIARRLKDVEAIDVGETFGHPQGMMLIQWIINNEIGDERYRHNYAVRKYTLQPGLKLDEIPFHSHMYVQSPHILKGRMVFESGDGEKVEVGAGDTVYFFSNEPHKGTVIGNEPVELLCIIDCPDGGKYCVPDKPKDIKIG
jgi:quercetin dioxygenase-like cupin family protein